jgi:Chaperone of endosialidase
MDILASRTCDRFRSLLDMIAAGLVAAPATNLTVLGLCVGDDGPAPAPNLTVLGPCVGDDNEVSDARLKEDARRIGTTVFGLPLYHFKYLGKPETYEGVMAQEVLRVMPSAVSIGADGFYRVNYGTLGTNMRRVS